MSLLYGERVLKELLVSATPPVASTGRETEAQGYRPGLFGLYW